MTRQSTIDKLEITVNNYLRNLQIIEILYKAKSNERKNRVEKENSPGKTLYTYLQIRRGDYGKKEFSYSPKYLYSVTHTCLIKIKMNNFLLGMYEYLCMKLSRE